MADSINAIGAVKSKESTPISRISNNEKLSFKKLLFGDQNFVSPNVPIGNLLSGKVTAAGYNE